jgi:2-haloalkanoic acid dehalogenase type II
MSIQAITFDLDDTLWAIEPVIQRAERAVHAHLTRFFPAIAERYDVDALRELRQTVGRGDPGRAHDLAYLRRESLRRASENSGYDPVEVADTCYRVFDQARHEVALFDDVLPTLERLSHRYRLGVLSNGTADVQRIGLGHLFSFSISARDVGAPKPDAAMFRAACRTAGVPATAVMHVGDHHEHDIAGAMAAGLVSVWINRRGEPWPGRTPPHAEIATLAELETVLEPGYLTNTVLTS